MDYSQFGARSLPHKGAPPLKGLPPDVGALFRQESGRAVATLIRILGDFDLAEDAVQEAFAVALERWPREGVPADPAAWIIRVGRNRAIDRLRREQNLARKLELLGRTEEPMAAQKRSADDPAVREGEVDGGGSCGPIQTTAYG